MQNNFCRYSVLIYEGLFLSLEASVALAFFFFFPDFFSLVLGEGLSSSPNSPSIGSSSSDSSPSSGFSALRYFSFYVYRNSLTLEKLSLIDMLDV